MAEPKKLRKYLTYEELKENIVDWSKKTVLRRVEQEGFPAIRDGNTYLFPADEVDLWFKKRKAN